MIWWLVRFVLFHYYSGTSVGGVHVVGNFWAGSTLKAGESGILGIWWDIRFFKPLLWIYIYMDSFLEKLGGCVCSLLALSLDVDHDVDLDTVRSISVANPWRSVENCWRCSVKQTPLLRITYPPFWRKMSVFFHWSARRMPR